uniref:Cholesterol 25-hydroxylase like 1, tandem duplicate 2 n=1 Tax=Cyclopterus lumpus TaxID=8103 RepID=A0A8C2X975_CYCLU
MEFGNDSLLQRLWDCMRLNYRDYLRSPLFPIVLTVSSYFVLCIYFLVCDIMGERWPWVQQFKFQPSRRPTASKLLHCAGVTFYNHAFPVLPASVAQWVWRPVTLPDWAPSLLELLAGVISNLLLFDFQYFIWHLLHYKIRWLYATFYTILHNYSSAFALAAGSCMVSGLLDQSSDPEMSPTEHHCGYDFPWSTSRLIPFGIYGGPSEHNVHHQHQFCGTFRPLGSNIWHALTTFPP